MNLIPVIDIKNGIAVLAQCGQRDNYQPIHSPLCRSANIYDVIEAFLQLAAFKIFYLADLNAVVQQGDNNQLIHALLRRYPEQTFWIDAGYQSPNLAFADVNNYRPVLGTECCTAKQIAQTPNALLSLDFSAQDKPLGEQALFEHSVLLSEQVIIMTLAYVGSNAGVDMAKLRYYQQTYPQIAFVAAGGVRDKSDLQALKTMGINSVLLASALHNKTISKADILSINANNF